jgi:3-hydroxyacyl-CoA dehydrogenase/enoyl-CoA hydratase/3-hydroxybutyryl-CoA epimerase
LKEADAASAFAAIEAMKASFRKLETMGRPVVALLAGSALGGGWEVALIGHARFSLDDTKIQFGTPEVSLGLIPGGTGITKTVRQLGLMAARPVPGRGAPLRAARGARARLGRGAVQQRRRDARAGAGLDRRPSRRNPALGPARLPHARRHAVEPQDRRRALRRSGHAGTADARLYPAPQAVLEAMVEGALVDYDTATRIESRKLAKVMVGQTARNMIKAFFFDLNAIRTGQARPKGFERWRPARVGVLGAGMMGAGIAHANAARGIPAC